MPIYEYRCETCGFQKEHLQKMNDPVLTVCPSCSQARYTKLLSAAGFQLKGSGWYATDFKSSGAADKSSSGEGTSSDSKPASTGCAGGCGCHSH